ncbi:hypothetical protein [Chromobacterium rhizoryzae]|uniref:hypothetical protein n=1 Tax=Chromobacterium rhizoryzae TaxID=1778675 RepID=UPI001D097745|nr:hypothetical protein [Chromobacterium rhizoryzae]
MPSTMPSQSHYIPSLSTLLFQLKNLRQQNTSLHPIDPLLHQLDESCQHFDHSLHLLSLEFGQVSTALTTLVTMLEQPNLGTLECEQVYCLLEPFAHRLQQTTRQMQELA